MPAVGGHGFAGRFFHLSFQVLLSGLRLVVGDLAGHSPVRLRGCVGCLHNGGFARLFRRGRGRPGLCLRLRPSLQEAQPQPRAQPLHRRAAEAYKEANARAQQQEHQPRDSHLGHQPAAHVVAVQTAQIEERLPEIHRHKAKEHREPHQQQRTGEEPTPQAQPAHLHKPDACRHEEHGYEDSRHAEAVAYQVAGQLGATRTGIVAHAVVGGQEVAPRAAVEDALVGRPRSEIGREGQQQESGK